MDDFTDDFKTKCLLIVHVYLIIQTKPRPRSNSPTSLMDPLSINFLMIFQFLEYRKKQQSLFFRISHNGSVKETGEYCPTEINNKQ